MVVQHNLTAMNSNRMLNMTSKTQSKSTEKLSSGYKINRAADDAAGLSISEKMRKQIRGLTQASANAQDGISMVQTAEGALNEVQDMLQRMNELAVKAANGTLSSDDRAYVQNEVDALITEIDRVAQTTKFNETYLLDGTAVEEDAGGFVGRLSDKVASTELGTQIVTNNATVVNDINTNFLSVSNNAKAGGIMDFSDITKDDIASLYGSGFSMTCLDCTRFMSVMFVDGSDPSEWIDNQNVTSVDTSKYESDGYAFGTNAKSGRTTFIDISDCNNGADVCNKVMNSYAKMCGNAGYVTGTGYSMDNGHHVMIGAQITGSTAKLALYDTSSTTPNTSAASTAVADGTGYSGTGAMRSGVIGEGKNFTFNTKKLNLHVGADATSNNQIEVTLGNLSKEFLGLRSYDYDWKKQMAGYSNHADVTTAEKALDCINAVSKAIQKVSTQRSAFGAIQNRLEHTINNLDNVVENTTSAESAIRDTDMAKEMVKYSNNNILAQAGQAMLAQANQSNQGVLSLL